MLLLLTTQHLYLLGTASCITESVVFTMSHVLSALTAPSNTVLTAGPLHLLHTALDPCRLNEPSCEQGYVKAPMSMQQLLDQARNNREALPTPFLPFFKDAATSLLQVLCSITASVSTVLHLLLCKP